MMLQHISSEMIRGHLPLPGTVVWLLLTVLTDLAYYVGLVLETLACFVFFFFLIDPAPTEISPLPLHAALPIWDSQRRRAVGAIERFGSAKKGECGLHRRDRMRLHVGSLEDRHKAVSCGLIDITAGDGFMEIGRAHV